MNTSTNTLAVRNGKAAERGGAKLYRIHLPGVGMFGSYPTIEAAQTAIYYLPIGVRKRATIHRCDGRSA